MPQTKLNSLRPGGGGGYGVGGYMTKGCGPCGVPATGWTELISATINATVTGIDQEFVHIGCTYDPATLLRTGRVFLKSIVTEDQTTESEQIMFLADGGTATVPYVEATHGRFVDCEDEPVEVSIQGCDDVAGDGSNIVTYFTVNRSHQTLGLSIDVGTFTDETQATAYVPVNPVDCSSIGVAAVRKEGRLEISGGTWSPTPLTVSYTIRVADIADTNTPPTFTDSFGNVTSLEAGESLTFDHGDDLLSDGLATVTANVGDRVIITYIETGV